MSVFSLDMTEGLWMMGSPLHQRKRELLVEGHQKGRGTHEKRARMPRDEDEESTRPLNVNKRMYFRAPQAF